MRYNERVQEYNTLAAAVPVEHHRRHLRLQGVSAVQRTAGSRAVPTRRLRSARRSAHVRTAGRDSMAIVDALLPEFDHEMTTTRKAARARARGQVRLEAAREVVFARRAGDARRQRCRCGAPMTLTKSEFDVGGATSRRRRRRRRPSCSRRFDRNVAGDPRRADRQDRRRADGAVVAEAAAARRSSRCRRRRSGARS